MAISITTRRNLTIDPPVYSPSSATSSGGCTDADLVPEEIQNKLMFWRDMLKLAQFDIGDQVAETIMAVAARGAHATEARICDAIGRFCGKSGRTVRYYYETAVYFPRETRQEYDMLAFSHFVFARYMGERWQEVLEFAASIPNCTEKMLCARFKFTPYTEEVVAPGSASSEDAGNYAPDIKSCESSHDYQPGDNSAGDNPSPNPRFAAHAGAVALGAVISALRAVKPIISEQLVIDAIDRLITDLTAIMQRTAREAQG